MRIWGRLFGRVVLVLAVFVAGFLGAKLGVLGTREVGASHNFSDVPDSAFYHDFVQFLVDNGITAGCGPGLFCGEQAVTRGQTAVFLQKLNDVVRSQALWAVVDEYYTLAGGFHATSATRLSPGNYEVVFDRDVSGCAYTATPGTVSEPSLGAAMISTRRLDNPNAVGVVTFSHMGTVVERSFRLVVHC